MTRRLGPEHLVLCAGTLGAADFETKARAAAAAGFDGVSVWLDDAVRARAAGRSMADLRAVLDGHGLGVAEIDPLLGWLPGADPGAGVTDAGAGLLRHAPDAFVEAAAELGARSINCALATDAVLDEDLLAESFAAVCDRAAGADVEVQLEFLPWTAVPDAAAALRVVERTGRANAGVTFDTWHHLRGGASPGALEGLDLGRVRCIQLSDVAPTPRADLVEETLHGRCLPGEGVGDLPGLLGALRSGGCTAPVGVEVFSDALAALPPDEAARRAYRAARDLVARWRETTA